MYQERLDKVMTGMADKEIPELIVSDPLTIYYLTGKMIHAGERMLVLLLQTGEQPTLIVNRLFPITAQAGLTLVFYDDTEDGVAVVAHLLKGAGKLGIDKFWPSQFLLRLQGQAPSRDYVLGSLITDGVRGVKSSAEIDLMRAASHSNDRVMGQAKQALNAEVTELEMSGKLAQFYAAEGNSGFSFEPIVAFGVNGADPHHENDGSTLQAGDSIIVDIGGVKDGYCSDMTRTFFYQTVSAKSKEVYETVLEANLRAIAAVKPGVSFASIDAAARDYITAQGYGEYFTHRTGHFIGLECHEAGDVSAANQQLVKPGMIFSIEPGIYLPGEVGVRIEDLVVATDTGVEVLNQFPKELTILP